VFPEQQPLAHDSASQTQAPPTQCWLSPHGAAVPQRQEPFVAQRSAVIPQAAHAAPPGAQLDSDNVRQVFPEQQPLPHDMASQTQLPPTQRCPIAQATPAPQAHKPALVQVSAIVGSHAAQAAPADPQRPSDRDTQELPSQQPVGHEPASHMHRLALHFWPTPHGAPVPHTQAPAAEQPSAFVMSHPTQTAPAYAQVETEGALQVAPEQQPLGHVVLLQPLQRPAVQVWFGGQVSQLLPPPPHELLVSPARQAPPEQQPSGHEVPSQTQVLPIHR
jgi:hypothetical protein